MKKTRFTEAQIVSILHQQEAGKSVKDISREQDISDDAVMVCVRNKKECHGACLRTGTTIHIRFVRHESCHWK